MTRIKRRQFVAIAATSLTIPGVVFGQQSSSDQISQEQAGLLLRTQLDVIQRLRSALIRLRQGRTPQNPLGDLLSIYEWAEWTETNLNRALNDESIRPPPSSICSGYSVPTATVSGFINETVDGVEAHVEPVEYDDLYNLDPFERSPTLRRHFQKLREAEEDAPDYDAAMNSLSELNQRTQLFEQYYRQLSQAIEALVYVPEYFTSRQAVLCWFQIETSIVSDLVALQEQISQAQTQIVEFQDQREAQLTSWFTAHQLMLRIERADISLERVKQEARRDRLEAIRSASVRLSEEQNRFREQRNRLAVELQAVQLDIQVKESEIANFQSLARSIRSSIETARRQLQQAYNLCPNQNNYQTCTHNDLKLRWDQSRQSMRSQLERNQHELERLTRQQRNSRDTFSRLALSTDAIESEMDALSVRLAAIDRQREDLARQLSDLLFENDDPAPVGLDELEINNNAEQDFISARS